MFGNFVSMCSDLKRIDSSIIVIVEEDLFTIKFDNCNDKHMSVRYNEDKLIPSYEHNFNQHDVINHIEMIKILEVLDKYK